MRKPAVLACLLLVACSSGPGDPIRNEAPGPPEVRIDMVGRHAAQLDDELGPRPAGSQQEQIASQYVLGHLQQAGYLVRLDAVPVGNLIESSNLLALPPSENDPEVVVVAPYDSPEGKATGGEEAGFLLELARSFNVASPGHDAEFAALGADSGADLDRLGSRRLVRLLIDEEVEARIVAITEVEAGAPLAIGGPLASEIDGSEGGSNDGSVYADAGFEYATVAGDPAELGAVLLDYLEQAAG